METKREEKYALLKDQKGSLGDGEFCFSRKVTKILTFYTNEQKEIPFMFF